MSEEIKALFIGGHADGIYDMVPYRPVIKRVVMEYGMTRATSELYCLEKFVAGARIVFFYRHQSLSIEDTIDRLINHYRP